MNYVPKLPDEHVNQPRQHPLVDIAFLLGGVLGIILIVYWLAGWAVDHAADHLPLELEQDLAARFEWPDAGKVGEADPRETRVKALLARMAQLAPPSPYAFRLSVQVDDTVNAVALPAGRIVVFSGLLDQLGSENELAMILGHELGHFAHRDHLRGLGRGLVLVTLSALLLGQDSGLTELAQGTLGVAHGSFTRKQETAADLYGIELLQKTYGHVGGATDFFERMAAKREEHGPGWLASHPSSRERVEQLLAYATAHGYARRATVAFPAQGPGQN